MSYDPIIRFYDDPGHPYWPSNMASIKAEIMAIATEHGYTGAAPKTIAGAIDALADTLAGEDVSSPRSIAGAIHALAPYIGSGGGGAKLGELAGMGIMGAREETSINVSTTPYDIMSGETVDDVVDSVYNNTNVLRIRSASADAPSGCYVMMQAAVSSDWTTDSLTVFDANGEQQITSGFECRVFNYGSTSLYADAYFTMQIPTNGLAVNFGGGGGGD